MPLSKPLVTQQKLHSTEKMSKTISVIEKKTSFGAFFFVYVKIFPYLCAKLAQKQT